MDACLLKVLERFGIIDHVEDTTWNAHGDTADGATMTVTNDLNVGGDFDVAGHAAMGNSASVDVDKILNVIESREFSGTTASAADFDVTSTGSVTIAKAITGFDFLLSNEVEHLFGSAQLIGMNFNIRHDAAKGISVMDGIKIGMSVADATTSVAVMRHLFLSGGFGNTAQTGTTAVGIDMALSVIGTFTNKYGIRIKKIEGATNVYGIALDGDGAGADIVFGEAQDVSLRYGGVNTELENLVGSGYFDVQMGLKTGGERIKNTSRYTTTQTIPTTDEIVFCNTDGGAWTATLPAGVEGASHKIINSGSSSNALTLTPDGAEDLIGANSSFTLYDGEALEITYNATDGWY